MNDVCIALNYYSPYVSGLTNVARDLAEELVRRGKVVTVVTSQHDSRLPLIDRVNGVNVIRSKVDFRIGKGVISLEFVKNVIRESRKSRVLNIHAPMLEAGILASLVKCPVILTYQCDISLPNSFLGSVQNFAMDVSTKLASRLSRMTVVSSEDYARHSRVAASLTRNMTAISPTCHMRTRRTPIFRDGLGLHIGFLGRLVEEKGIEFLIDAFSSIPNSEFRLLIGGDYENVVGGSIVSRITDKIGADDRIRLLGFVPDEELDGFYSSIDVFCLPSVNPFEAFGIVQVEAMMLDIPVIATDMPGVRTPIKATKMGALVPPKDVAALSKAISEISNGTIDVKAGGAEARRIYSLGSVVDQYQALFTRFSN